MAQPVDPLVPREQPAPGMKTEYYLEQYKAYLADLGNIGTRYATVQGFYVSVIAGLLGILALTESQKLLNKLPVPTLLVVCVFSMVMCFVWYLTIRFYKKLFLAKFTVLRKIESYLPLDCFKEEYALLTGNDLAKGKDGRPGLLRVEQYIPLVLISFFVALAVIGVIYRN